MPRTIVVSNRLPLSIDFMPGEACPRISESIGGLTTGMQAVHAGGDSCWIGWSGLLPEELSAGQREAVEALLLREHRCKPIFLSKELVDRFYYGFCNKTIWPVFHYFHQLAEWDAMDWEVYCTVNALFAEAVCQELRPDDRIWIHDYQLMLLPHLIRERHPEANIGFFLHIPFPSYEIFRLIPWRSEILEGMLGANLIGFHTYDYVRHFLSSTRRLLGHDNTFGRILLRHHSPLVDAFPMGIDYKRYNEAQALESNAQDAHRLMTEIRGKQVILSVDRLDYTKGIPERICAFETFLEDNPQYREKVHLILITAPSRTEVNTYKALRSEVEELVGRVNGRLGKIGWVPIWFFCQSFNFEELVGLYRSADVLLVTPLRDGMNLVAKEYVAARSDYRGVTVLSETVGASNELGDAIQVNPNDRNAIAKAILQALEMPIIEQIERNKNMHARLSRYTVSHWAKDFVSKLDEQHERQILYCETVLLELGGAQALREAYAKATQRLLILDYDGTLARLEKHPDDAAPDDTIKRLLSDCAADAANTVLLASGRKKEELNSWFADIPIDLSAEHGLWVRKAGEGWQAQLVLRDDWKTDILPILESFVDRTPGSFVEEKTAGLAWHYRNCEPEQANVRLNDLRETLISYTQNLGLSLLDGKKVLEIRDSHANKGSLIEQWLAHTPWDFILCAGDDVTDEDMFTALPPEAFSLKVGRGQSAARFHVKSYTDIIGLLSEIRG